MRPRRIYTKVEQPADVKVLVPYVKPSHTLQTVVDCLRAQAVQPELHKVNDGDGYWTLLRDSWAEGREFFIVEHDVLVWQGAIQQMTECEGDWCSLPTICRGRMITTTFGCVRFGQATIDRNPDFWEDIPTTWFHLDAGFADKMGWPYIRPHVHWPAATHLNEVQWPDEVSTRYALERKMAWQSMEEGNQTVVRVKYRVAEDKGHRGERVAAGVVEHAG